MIDYRIICPVCGKYRFEDEYEECPICGWKNDLIQNDDPDEWGGENWLSMNEVKKLYELGRLDLVHAAGHGLDFSKVEKLEGEEGFLTSISRAERCCMGDALGERLMFACPVDMEMVKAAYGKLVNMSFKEKDKETARVNFLEKVREYSEKNPGRGILVRGGMKP